MKKTLVALAVLSTMSLAGSAFAATSNLDISGTLAVGIENMRSNDSISDATHVQNYNSRITLAGQENLDADTSVIFSLTYGLPVSDNSGATLLGQNQYLGLRTAYGTVMAGTLDNPVKGIGQKYDLFSDYIGDAGAITAQGFTDVRAGNVVAYVSPKVYGATATYAHASNDFKSPADDELHMLAVSYENGPMSIGLGYHVEDSSMVGAEEKAWRLGAGYSFGDINVVASLQKVDNAGGASVADSKAWSVGANYKMGAATFKTQYTQLDDEQAGMDANQWSVGVDYSLSKRTVLMAAYSRVDNGAGSSYGTSGSVEGTDISMVAAGANPASFGIGVKHSF